MSQEIIFADSLCGVATIDEEEIRRLYGEIDYILIHRLDKQKAEFVGLVKTGLSVRQAYLKAGIGPHVVERWIRDDQMFEHGLIKAGHRRS